MEIIGIISDTHIPSRTKEVPTRVFEIFNDVNLIIHVGDFFFSFFVQIFIPGILTDNKIYDQ